MKKIFLSVILLIVLVSCNQTKTSNITNQQKMYLTEDGRYLDSIQYVKYRDSVSIVIEEYNKRFDSVPITY